MALPVCYAVMVATYAWKLPIIFSLVWAANFSSFTKAFKMFLSILFILMKHAVLLVFFFVKNNLKEFIYFFNYYYFSAFVTVMILAYGSSTTLLPSRRFFPWREGTFCCYLLLFRIVWIFFP